MKTIDINFIPESRKYLKRFIDSHYKTFFADMNEYQPHKGYGIFPNSSEIVQCMREITHISGEVFGDLSIPEKFNSPTDLIDKTKWFIDHLESFDSYFIEALNILTKENQKATIPEPINEINNHRRNTIDVFKTFLQLAQQELSDTGQITFSNSQTEIEKIENLLRTFHNVCKQILQRRKENGIPRPTLTINDEYDVQDLLHGLLKIYFSDIRPEEWTPSYAGSSKRSDFLLKKEKIIIEVKKTRTTLKDKEVGEQLIIDIANYKKHPDCKTLICFVYDPDKLITNPKGIENDLKEISSDFKVLVFILP
nr:hypothetical protein [uncultured Fluviicola sp.]